MSNSISTGVAYKDPEFSDVTITGTLTVGGSVFNANAPVATKCRETESAEQT